MTRSLPQFAAPKDICADDRDRTTDNCTGQGAERTNPVDFAGKDLSDLDLSNVDFGRADLSGANLFGTRLVSANLAGAKLVRATLNGAWVMGATFAGADLSGSSMLGPKSAAEARKDMTSEIQKDQQKIAQLEQRRAVAVKTGASTANIDEQLADLRSETADLDGTVFRSVTGMNAAKGMDRATGRDRAIY